MYKIRVNNKHEYKIEPRGQGEWDLNGTAFALDIARIKDGSFHLIRENKSYNIEVLKFDAKEKTLLLKINGNKYEMLIKDKYDELLHNLGLDNLATKKVNDVKAPMPGLVLNILVKEGSQVKKGEALIVLEAMKMENILKSPADGTVKKIAVKKGVAVEKNQVLINF
jgi:biotin carboxyl carrier protein